MGDYFVMVYSTNGDFLPMLTEDDDFDVAKFETFEEAKEAAENCPLGAACGFEIFNINEPCEEW